MRAGSPTTVDVRMLLRSLTAVAQSATPPTAPLLYASARIRSNSSFRMIGSGDVVPIRADWVGLRMSACSRMRTTAVVPYSSRLSDFDGVNCSTLAVDPNARPSRFVGVYVIDLPSALKPVESVLQ